MGAYDRARATAIRLLGKKGVTITLKRPNQGAPDPIAGSRATGGDKTATFKVLGLPPGRGADKEIGTLVNRRLKEFHMARTGGTLDPQPGDIIPWAGQDWPVIWTAVYDPDASGVVYAKAYAEIGG